MKYEKENWAEDRFLETIRTLVVVEFIDLSKASQEDYFQLELDVGWKQNHK